MDMVGEAIEQRTGETLALEGARPFLEWEIRCDDGRSTLVALAENLKEELGASLGQWHIAEFVDDEEFDGGELGLKFEQTLFITRLHQLMDEPNRRRKGDGKAALAGGEAERQARMRLSGAAVAQSDDVLAGDDKFAAREFENERLVERRDGGEVECVETLHCREAGGADAAL